LIITGLFKVENDIDASTEYMTRISRASLRPLGELCETVHSLGTKIFVQLTAGFGRVARPHRRRGQPVSASAIPYYWDPTITCMTLVPGNGISGNGISVLAWPYP
jgi:2-enoate reductase